jgi:ribosomal protein S18 acetylase RimI-like enzyme
MNNDEHRRTVPITFSCESINVWVPQFFTETATTTVIQTQHNMTTLLASSILAFTGGGLWYLFRRQAPMMTTQDLPSNVDDCIQVVSQLSKEERTTVKTAFLSGDDFAWMVGGKHFKTNLDEKQHVEATFYMLECVLTFAERFGHILVSRDADGKFEGAIALIPPYTSPLLFTLHFYRSVIPMGIPVPVKMGKDVAARFDSFMETATQHKELMKGTPHWYVQVLGVSTDAQGKGVGRKLMDAAIAIARETPLYLECHDGNVSFYKKMGYQQKRRYELAPKGIEDVSTFYYNGMTYGM